MRAVVAADDNTCIVKRQDVQFRYDCKMKEQKFEDGDGISSAIWPNAVVLEGCFKNEITRVEDASPRNEELLLTYKLMITWSGQIQFGHRP